MMFTANLTIVSTFLFRPSRKHENKVTSTYRMVRITASKVQQAYVCGSHYVRKNCIPITTVNPHTINK